jgi:hypothetical protein
VIRPPSPARRPPVARRSRAPTKESECPPPPSKRATSTIHHRPPNPPDPATALPSLPFASLACLPARLLARTLPSAGSRSRHQHPPSAALLAWHRFTSVEPAHHPLPAVRSHNLDLPARNRRLYNLPIRIRLPLFPTMPEYRHGRSGSLNIQGAAPPATTSPNGTAAPTATAMPSAAAAARAGFDGPRSPPSALPCLALCLCSCRTQPPPRCY